MKKKFNFSPQKKRGKIEKLRKSDKALDAVYFNLQKRTFPKFISGSKFNYFNQFLSIFLLQIGKKLNKQKKKFKIYFNLTGCGTNGLIWTFYKRANKVFFPQ